MKELIGDGLMQVEAYAVRLQGGDFAALAPGRMMARSLHAVRDHRSAALAAFRAESAASHVFTCATGAREPLCVCWRRVSLLAALGELDGPGEAPAWLASEGDDLMRRGQS